MPFAAIIGGVGALTSGILGSNAARSAASTEANAADQASQTQLQMFDQAQSNLAPWLTGGGNALAALQKLLGIGPGGTGNATSPILQMLGLGTGGINPAQFQGSPGYQFQLGQGMNAVTNSAAASGGLGGNALKSLQSYGTGLANQDWNNYLSQLSGGYQNLVGNLTNLSGQGQGAATNTAQAALQTGQSIGNNQITAGGNLAAGQIGSANALAGGINGIGNNALLYSLLNSGGLGGGGGALAGGTWDT